MGAGPSAMEQQLAIMATERRASVTEYTLRKQRTVLAEKMEKAISDGDTAKAKNYSRMIAKKNSFISQTTQELTDLESVRFGLAGINSAQERMKIYKGVGKIADRTNKKMNVAKFAKDQIKIQRSIEKFKDVKQQVNEAMSGMQLGGSGSSDGITDDATEEMDADEILNKALDQQMLSQQNRMKDTPNRKPGSSSHYNQLVFNENDLASMSSSSSSSSAASAVEKKQKP